MPEYGEVHSQVLQDVLRRVDKTYQAFFRRLVRGETPGSPRFQGTNRYHSFTYPQYGNGTVLDVRILSLSKIRRIPLRMHRPLAGMPKTVTISREADGWYACVSCDDVPTALLPFTGQETGIDVGLKVFLLTLHGGSSPRGARFLAPADARTPRRRGPRQTMVFVAPCRDGLGIRSTGERPAQQPAAAPRRACEPAVAPGLKPPHASPLPWQRRGVRRAKALFCHGRGEAGGESPLPPKSREGTQESPMPRLAPEEGEQTLVESSSPMR